MIATALASFILAILITLTTSFLNSGDDFVQGNHFNRQETIKLIDRKIANDTPYSKEKAGLTEKLKNFESQLLDRKKTDEELTKAIVDLRLEIARWADAAEKNRIGQ